MKTYTKILMFITVGVLFLVTGCGGLAGKKRGMSYEHISAKEQNNSIGFWDLTENQKLYALIEEKYKLTVEDLKVKKLISKKGFGGYVVNGWPTPQSVKMVGPETRVFTIAAASTGYGAKYQVQLEYLIPGQYSYYHKWKGKWQLIYTKDIGVDLSSVLGETCFWYIFIPPPEPKINRKGFIKNITSAPSMPAMPSKSEQTETMIHRYVPPEPAPE